MPFVPARLRERREAKRLSQEELGKLCHTSGSLIQRYEYGEVKPGSDRLEQFVEFLETNLDYLMGRSNFSGKRTPAHDEADAAFDRGDIDTILRLIGEQVRKQDPPEKRTSGRTPRAKKKLTLRR